MKPLDQSVLEYVAAYPGAGKEDIRRNAAPASSPSTIWRSLKRLVDEGHLEVSGRGRATAYSLAGAGVVRNHLKTPYNRRLPTVYRKDFIDRYVPNRSFYLYENDRRILHEAGKPVMPVQAGTYAQRILERLLIDLSWASSRMEGNTYNILETEQLVRFGQEASGKTRKEAVMILNHKKAIEYVVGHLAGIAINRLDLCSIHALLSDGLLIDPVMSGRLRRMPVGIFHSSYSPLDDPITVEAEFNILVEKAAMIDDPFEQSFFLLVHIPYLQAFDDINKRTSRIASNIPLLKADLAPMSFHTMDDAAYLDGLIGIYELNNVSLFRETYIDAYLASSANYRTFRAEVESPDKSALVYRDFVHEAIRRSVLEWRGLRKDLIRAMAIEAGIPEADLNQVLDYVDREFRGLHEGNAIRYRLRAEELAGIRVDNVSSTTDSV